jgi:HPt (histidine-containing phosphotransfer) domain-containing protein
VVATAKELTLQETRQLETSVSVVVRKSGDLRKDLGRVVRDLLRSTLPPKPAAEDPNGPILVKVRAILKDMIPGFLSARRGEITAIRQALEKLEFEPIRVMGHNMKGIGASYGFPPITEFGRQIEAGAVGKSGDEIVKAVEGLENYLARVQVVPE